ncbi:SLATT domain-containing protein [Chromobacterium rhizoryzae]|uniref:SLATT domain-containing protein n=1 Tax=Chromobacterium rhizoryzae TaxID=1778675 RepID=UPI001D05E2B3|nr:SLATT domain-containing protein [Chromobacterium rhizoryzae]
MTKDQLLKNIAETGYNVGFGGRKHWATYDIVDKIPGFIGFFSLAIGIFALIHDELSTKNLSAALTIIGLIGLYITFYDSKKSDYEKTATELTKLFNLLRDLYREVDGIEDPKDSELDKHNATLKEIENKYYSIAISKQILFSDWYAHYKFFWQYQIDWINKEKQFRFWRDKVPLTGWIAVLISSFVLIFYLAKALPVAFNCIKFY